MSFLSTCKLILKGKMGLLFSLKPFRLQRRLYEPTEYQKLALQLQLHGVSTVCDVGANKGQFASNLLRAGFKGKVISFEPLQEAYAILQHAAANQPNWTVAPRCAVGAAADEISINVSQNSQSSSFLKITEQALIGAPKAQFTHTEKVRVIPLDSCELITSPASTFIKIDTQGFEMEVLKGATELLKTARGVQLEMSFTPMYEGAPDFETLYRFMLDRGFELWGMDTAFRDPKTRRLYQVDATFFRKA